MINLPIKLLKRVSIWYLALPVLILFGTWFKPVYGIPMILIFLYSFFKSETSSDAVFSVSKSNLFFFILVVFIWVAFSGAGGMGFQSHDMVKTNSIIKDIANNSWPVFYKESNLFLGSYLGYFFSVPTLFYFLEWESLNILMFLYTFLGCLIGVLWFGVLCGDISFKSILFFVFIGGLDLAGFFHSFGFTEGITLLSNNFLDNQPFWYNSIDSKISLMYHSNTQLLYWGTWHSIPCWVLSGLFFYDLMKNKDILDSPLYLILVPFWSPFLLIGLFPFFIVKLLEQRIIPFLKVSNLILIPLFLFLIFFVNSVPINELGKGLIFYKGNRLLSYVHQFKSYLWFLFFEVLIWVIPVYFLVVKKKEIERKWFIVLVVSLCLIPLYKLGKYNDWVQRVSMPALFLLWVYVYQIFKTPLKLYFKSLLLVLLFLTSWDSIFFIGKSIVNSNYMISFKPKPFSQVKTFPQTSDDMGWDRGQALVYPDSYFYKTFLKSTKK